MPWLSYTFTPLLWAAANNVSWCSHLQPYKQVWVKAVHNTNRCEWKPFTTQTGVSKSRTQHKQVWVKAVCSTNRCEWKPFTTQTCVSESCSQHKWVQVKAVHNTNGCEWKQFTTQMGVSESSSQHKWVWVKAVHNTNGCEWKPFTTQMGVSESSSQHKWVWVKAVHNTNGCEWKQFTKQMGVSESSSQHKHKWMKAICNTNMCDEWKLFTTQAFVSEICSVLTLKSTLHTKSLETLAKPCTTQEKTQQDAKEFCVDLLPSFSDTNTHKNHCLQNITIFWEYVKMLSVSCFVRSAYRRTAEYWMSVCWVYVKSWN